MKIHSEHRAGWRAPSAQPGKATAMTARRAPGGGAGWFGSDPARSHPAGASRRRVRRQGLVHIARFRAMPVEEPDGGF